METFITLVLADGTSKAKKFSVRYDAVATSGIIQYGGCFYVYQVFKWQQQEIWYSRVAPPMVLPTNTPEVE